MLPILSLFGLALASIFLPDFDDKADDKQDHVSDQKAESDRYDAAELAGPPLTEPVSDTNDASPSGFLDENAGHDQLIGTQESEALWGLDGNDSMWGDSGSDTLFGGAGDDLLFGDDDAESDALIGGDGNDTITAGQFDRVTLGAGDDVLKAHEGAAVHVSDFNPDDDRIEVIYEAGTEPPTLDTVQTETGIQLKADDSVVAILDGVYELKLSDVKLIAA